ncbi:unnamed protein product, partial [marine sediment metagenome]
VGVERELMGQPISQNHGKDEEECGPGAQEDPFQEQEPEDGGAWEREGKEVGGLVALEMKLERDCRIAEDQHDKESKGQKIDQPIDQNLSHPQKSLKKEKTPVETSEDPRPDHQEYKYSDKEAKPSGIPNHPEVIF